MSLRPLEGRVLVAQTAYLGDVTLTTALLRGLREGLHPRQLDLLVGRPYAELLAGSPDVDRVVCFDKRGTDKGVRGLIRAAKRLRGNYDAAIVPVRSFRTALLVARAGIPWRSGFSGGLGSALFTRTTQWEPGLTHVERLAKLAPEVRWDEVGLKTRLAVTHDERQSATELLRAAGLDPARPIVAVHPGSTWATKRWPAERFGEVVRSLLASGIQVCVLGTAEDVGLGETVVGRVDSERKSGIQFRATENGVLARASGATGEAAVGTSVKRRTPSIFAVAPVWGSSRRFWPNRNSC
jgi:heptosyltransferase-2